MSFSSTLKQQEDYQRQKRIKTLHGYLLASVLQHDTEHEWRSRGEFAINEEMEKRVRTWLWHKGIR